MILAESTVGEFMKHAVKAFINVNKVEMLLIYLQWYERKIIEVNES